ncbi:MAG TPA: hypothetical protein PLE92_11850, partial [Lentisphaeria bacterium]|nr:hypothetical protein [Lentisphaeria bacterium]
MNCDVNLGLPAALAAKWAVGREASAACFPEDGVFFLQEGFVKEIVALSGLCPEAQPAFFAAAAQIRSTPELLAFAWHCHWRLNLAAIEDGYF